MKEELENAAKEYNSFFDLITVENDGKNDYLNIVTVENLSFKIYCGGSGWWLNMDQDSAETTEFYETFETVAFHISNHFKTKFFSSVNEKLLAAS